jgi:hypothetical protein
LDEGLFGNRMQKRISGTKRKEVAGNWSRLLNGELHNFYSSRNVIRAGYVARMGEIENTYKILFGKTMT